VLADCEGEPELILIATGSEVQLALGAHETLSGEGIRSRVVSLPCWEIFEREDAEYRDSVLPPAVTARVAIEEASTLGWERYVGTAGAIMGMTTFGQSGKFADVEAEFGFTPDHVAAVAREVAQAAAVKSATT
jgi:transketolase